MKNLLSALACLIAVAAPQLANADSNEVASCRDLELYQQDESGKGSFQPADISISVYTSSTGKYGYTGLILRKNGQKYLENDTQFKTVTAEQAKEIKDLATTLLPNLKWDKVVSVRTATVGVKADRDDGGGIAIYDLLAKDQSSLGKVARVGWGFGRCK